MKNSDEKKTEKNEVATSAPSVEPTPVVDSKLKSVREWAIATGNGPQKRSKNTWTKDGTKEPAPAMSSLKGSMLHEIAAVLHGWREHEHHAGAPLLMTLEDYLAALKATMPEKGNPVAHKPALSPHKGGGVKVTFKG